MNLFCDLAAIDQTVLVTVKGHYEAGRIGSVMINDQLGQSLTVGLLDSIRILVSDFWIETVVIDGIDVTHFVPVQGAAHHCIEISEPFYRWWHVRSGQGWLLYPHKAG